MINKINNINIKNVSFCSNHVSSDEPKAQYQSEKNDKYVRDIIRDDIDEHLGVAYKYADTIGKMSYVDLIIQMGKFTKSSALDDIPTEKPPTKTELHVDESKLREIGFPYCNCKRKNELYSGPRLVTKPNGIELAKQAGIKTVLSLENHADEFYCDPVEKVGLKYIALSEIGNHTLHVFDIIPTQSEAKTLDKIIDNPEVWITQNPDGTKIQNIDKTIEDVQTFFDILDGKNDDCPLPMYFGCQWGTNRTFTWYQFYKILKNEDRTKPLSHEKIEELIQFRKDTRDAFY